MATKAAKPTEPTEAELLAKAYDELQKHAQRLGFSTSTDVEERRAHILETGETTPPFLDTVYYRSSPWGTWGVEVTVTLRTQPREARTGRKWRYAADISWSSTYRDIATATLAVAQYQRAIELAAMAEMLFR